MWLKTLTAFTQRRICRWQTFSFTEFYLAPKNEALHTFICWSPGYQGRNKPLLLWKALWRRRVFIPGFLPLIALHWAVVSACTCLRCVNTCTSVGFCSWYSREPAAQGSAAGQQASSEAGSVFERVVQAAVLRPEQYPFKQTSGCEILEKSRHFSMMQSSERNPSALSSPK